MNSIEIINNDFVVVEIQTPGPQGRIGDTPETGSLLKKDVFYDFTSSYNTGSFSGSYVGFFKGELDSSVLATSSSHALESISSSFLYGDQITQSTGSSEFLLMSQKSITYYLENIPIDGGNAFTLYN